MVYETLDTIADAVNPVLGVTGPGIPVARP